MELELSNIQKYVDNPYHCPYCQSEKMEASGSFENDGKYCWQKAECYECKMIWTEFFTMTTIVEGL